MQAFRTISQGDMHGPSVIVSDRQQTERPWQTEPSWTSRPRVKQQQPADPFDTGLVRMSENTNVRLRTIQEKLRVPPYLSALIDDMPYGDPASSQFDHRFRGTLSGFSPIHVSRHRDHRRDPLQLLDHSHVSDVARMNDAIDSLKMLSKHRIEQAVRVGHDPHANLHAHSLP